MAHEADDTTSRASLLQGAIATVARHRKDTSSEHAVARGGGAAYCQLSFSSWASVRRAPLLAPRPPQAPARGQ